MEKGGESGGKGKKRRDGERDREVEEEEVAAVADL